MNPFTERYRNLKSGELIAIVNNPEGFQELAVEAAQAELAKRNLSDEAMETAVAEAEAERKAKQWREDRKQAIADKATTIGTSVLGMFSPVQGQVSTIDRQIFAVTVFFAIVSIIQFYNAFFFIQFLFSSSTNEWDVSTLLYFFRLCFAPATAFLFWKRAKVGWLLAASLMIYSALAPLASLTIDLIYLTDDRIGGVMLDLFPLTPLYSLGILLLWCGFLWVVCKEKIRTVFGVDKKFMLVTMGIVGALSVMSYSVAIGLW